MSTPFLNVAALLPLIIVFSTGMIVLLLDLVVADKRTLGWLSLIGVIFAGIVGLAQQALPGFDPTFQNVAINDAYANFFNMIILFTAGLSILMALGYLGEVGLQRGEYYAILLFAASGMMAMAMGTELMVIFIGLETMSIALYIMTALDQERKTSLEAGIKYFLMGSFASAFFLYGVALVYGVTGHTNMNEIGMVLSASADKSPIALIGLGLILVGFAFKVAAFPFHWWTPDVYYGAPTSVTTFMSVGAKAAAFAALVRLLMVSFTPSFMIDWQLALAILAVLTMTLGNLAALAQQDVKRMLAYSSIAHAGYIFVGVVGASTAGVTAAVFYMMVYTFMNIGAFTVISVLERKDIISSFRSDYAGLSSRHPTLAMVMAVFMFSLTGFPLLGGFWGKVYLFQAAIDAGFTWLAVVAVINSGIAAFYYLSIVVQMYMKPASSEALNLEMAFPTRLALGLATVATIILGIWPGVVLNFTVGGLFG